MVWCHIFLIWQLWEIGAYGLAPSQNTVDVTLLFDLVHIIEPSRLDNANAYSCIWSKNQVCSLDVVDRFETSGKIR